MPDDMHPRLNRCPRERYQRRCSPHRQCGHHCPCRAIERAHTPLQMGHQTGRPAPPGCMSHYGSPFAWLYQTAPYTQHKHCHQGSTDHEHSLNTEFKTHKVATHRCSQLSCSSNFFPIQIFISRIGPSFLDDGCDAADDYDASIALPLRAICYRYHSLATPFHITSFSLRTIYAAAHIAPYSPLFLAR